MSSVPVHHKRFAVGYFQPKKRDRVYQIGLGSVLGHIGVFSAVTIYYLATQKIPWVRDHWNHLFSFKQWPEYRHAVRGAEEGIWGGSLALLAFANSLRDVSTTKGRFMRWLMGYTAEPDWFDKLSVKSRLIPNRHQGYRTKPYQYLLAPITVNLAALPGLVLGYLLVFGVPALLNTIKVHLHAGTISATIHGSGFWQDLGNVWTQQNDAKLIGLLGMFFFARRAFLKIGIDLQDFLTDRRARRYMLDVNKRTGFKAWAAEPHFPYPPVYRAEFWHKAYSGVLPKAHGNVVRWATLLVIPIMLAASWYGWTILQAAK